MADIVVQHNIGAYVSVVTSVEPQSSAAATINGASIDRAAHQDPLSCVMHQEAGAIGGAPSTTSVTATLQHSPDNSTWSNYLPDGVTAQTTAALTAANTENGLNIDLTMAYRYLRVVTTVAFTGGTSPTALVAAQLVLGGEALLAAI